MFSRTAPGTTHQQVSALSIRVVAAITGAPVADADEVFFSFFATISSSIRVWLY
jgi:hypothetical protein